MQYPRDVVVREVGPRDGLQAEPWVPTELKVQIIDAVSAAGVRRIEVTSFMNPRVIPQTADAEELLQRIARRRDVAFEALISTPNNAVRALDAGISRILVAIAATDAFNVANFRRTRAESFADFEKCAELARRRNVAVTGIIGASTGCPFTGRVARDEVLDMAEAFAQRGADEIFIGDSMGFANPQLMAELVAAVRRRLPSMPLGAHIHNTRGMGLANVLASMDLGVAVFDGSIGGLGGCPFDPQAAGNICTEDLVHMLDGMGIDTGIDLDALIEASKLTERIMNKRLPGHVMHWRKSFSTHPVPEEVRRHLDRVP
jgi:hydroxymethylglutaryl-CoA lyase